MKPSLIVPLWPGAQPGPAPEAQGPEADQSKPGEGRTGGKSVIRLGNVARPELHVFLPPASRRNSAGVVVCPGGGFNILAWDLEGTEVASWLNKRGVAAFVLKYRVPTGRQKQSWLGPAIDAQRALRLARAGRFGVEKLGVLGFSAGGKTAGVAVLQNGKPLYEPQDEADRASCRPDFGCLIYPAYFCDEKNQLLPEWGEKFTRETPPLFLAHTADDPVTCHSSIGLFVAGQKAGASVELHLWESGGHGYGLRPEKDKPVTTDWPVQCEKWLQQRGIIKTR
jgi:acetyl esterase/lipase